MFKKLEKNVIEKLNSTSQLASLNECILQLVYNSLDANADFISINVDFSSFDIKICDNGSSVALENANNLGERYFTNKLSSSSSSNRFYYGHKGEFLSNLIQISKQVEISTPTFKKTFLNQSNDVNGGSIQSFVISYSSSCENNNSNRFNFNWEHSNANSVPATTTCVSASNLFGVHELRQNHLRKTTTTASNHQLSSLIASLETISLINFDRNIVLNDLANQKTYFSSFKASSMKNKFVDLFGSYFESTLKEFNYEATNHQEKSVCQLSGLFSTLPKHFERKALHVHRSSQLQFIFMNKCLIKEKSAYKLVCQALKSSKRFDLLGTEPENFIFCISIDYNGPKRKIDDLFAFKRYDQFICCDFFVRQSILEFCKHFLIANGYDDDREMMASDLVSSNSGSGVGVVLVEEVDHLSNNNNNNETTMTTKKHKYGCEIDADELKNIRIAKSLSKIRINERAFSNYYNNSNSEEENNLGDERRRPPPKKLRKLNDEDEDDYINKILAKFDNNKSNCMQQLSTRFSCFDLNLNSQPKSFRLNSSFDLKNDLKRIKQSCEKESKTKWIANRKCDAASSTKESNEHILIMDEIVYQNELSGLNEIDREKLKQLKVLGQFEFKFILAKMKVDESRFNLFILDQHACDERVQLEKILEENIKQNQIVSEELNAFYKRKLSFQVKSLCVGNELLAKFGDRMKRYGFDLEFKLDPTNGTLLKINLISAPKLIVKKLFVHFNEMFPIINKFLEHQLREIQFSELVNDNHLPKDLNDLFNMEACKNSIKFGDVLVREKMQTLISSLIDCKLPFICAHGRPTLQPIASISIEKQSYRKKLNFSKLNNI